MTTRTREVRTSDVCKAAGCGRPFWAKGYCTLHYGRWKLYGDPLHRSVRTREECEEETCDRPAATHGYCRSHYMQFLRHGKTGPLRSNRNPLAVLFPGDAKGRGRGCLIGRTISICKGNASTRGLEWSLEDEEAAKLITGDCHYCGETASWPDRKHGIDRVDNAKGYVRGNVVSCCWRCNCAKGASTLSDFMEYLYRIAEKWKTGNPS